MEKCELWLLQWLPKNTTKIHSFLSICYIMVLCIRGKRNLTYNSKRRTFPSIILLVHRNMISCYTPLPHFYSQLLNQDMNWFSNKSTHYNRIEVWLLWVKVVIFSLFLVFFRFLSIMRQIILFINVFSVIHLSPPTVCPPHILLSATCANQQYFHFISATWKHSDKLNTIDSLSIFVEPLFPLAVSMFQRWWWKRRVSISEKLRPCWKICGRLKVDWYEI